MTARHFKIAVLVLLAGISLWIACAYQSRAFPIVNVPFKISRAEAETKMKGIIVSMGQSLDGYFSTSGFGENSRVQNFIERDYSSAQVEKSVNSGVAIYHWDARWFKPGQYEDFYASLNTAGELVYYSHVIEEARALPFLEKDAARKFAEDFLRTRVKHHPFEKLRFISDGTKKLSHRTDYTFTWEQDDLRLGEAAYEITVRVHGNEIGKYDEDLRIPEAWARNFSRLREVNKLCSTIANFFLMPLMIALFAFFIRAVKRRDIRWGSVVSWKWLVFFAVVFLLGFISGFPEALFDYTTTQSWNSFLAGSITGAIQSVLLTCFGIWFLLLVSDSIYREHLPQLPSFRQSLNASALFTLPTVRALGIGIVAATVSLAYVVLFYMAGRHWGAWCPVEIDYSKTLGGWMPWIGPMQTGLTAALSEEMLFRVVALLLFWWAFRIRWLAVLLSAVLWAFLHSNYPQMPGYIRGLELTIVGIAWGILMLRYGIVTTLVAHYLYDCWLGSIIVFGSASTGNKVGALIVSLWPVVLFLWACTRKKTEISPFVEQLPDTSQPLPLTLEKSQWIFSFVPISRLKAVSLTVISVTILAVLYFLPVPGKEFIHFGIYGVSREQIKENADAVVRQHGFNPADYQRVVSLSLGSIPSPEYLLTYGNFSQIANFLEKEWWGLAWNVRYFKILSQEGFTLYFDRKGKLIQWVHKVPREAPGAELEEAAALALARQTLAKDYGVDLDQENLVVNHLTKQEHRKDYYFAFERKNFSSWGDAKLRTTITVQGDEAMAFKHYLEIPESWRIEHERSGWRKFMADEFSTALVIVKFILVFAFFIYFFRKHVIPWRQAFILALFPVALEVIDLWNELPLFYNSYSTTTPLINFLVSKTIKYLSLFMGIYVAMVFLIGVSLGMLRWAFGFELKDILLWPQRSAERAAFWLHTLAISIASISSFVLFDFFKSTINGLLMPVTALNYSYFSVVNTLPWLDAWTSALGKGFTEIWSTGIFASFIYLLWRRFPRLSWCLLLLFPMISLINEKSWKAFFIGIFFAEIGLLLSIFLIVRVWRFNAVAIFLTYALYRLGGYIILQWSLGGAIYRSQVIPSIALCITALFIGIVAHLICRRYEAKE